MAGYGDPVEPGTPVTFFDEFSYSHAGHAAIVTGCSRSLPPEENPDYTYYVNLVVFREGNVGPTLPSTIKHVHYSERFAELGKWDFLTTDHRFVKDKD